MAVKPVIQIGDKRLKGPNVQVGDYKSAEVLQVIQDLTDTMRATELVGIAAPQIGDNLQIFLTEPRETKTRPKDQTDELRVYINPTIISVSDEQVVIFEGCGSVLNGQMFGPVKRSKQVIVEALDIHGNKFRISCDGILARVIQHEIDHLQGKEFVEQVCDFQQLMDLPHYIEYKNQSIERMKSSEITIKKFTYL